MRDSPVPEVIDLISDSEEDAAQGRDAEDSWSDGGDVPSASGSDEDDVLPPVWPAEGDEDEESSSDGDVEMGSPSRETPPVQDSAAGELYMPAIPERERYVMNYLTPLSSYPCLGPGF